MNIQPSSLSLRFDPDLRPKSELEKKATELSKYKVLSDESLGNLSCLPNELITRIFNYLGAQACKSLSLVSTPIFSLVGMQLPKVTFLDLSQPITQLSAPELIENVKISSKKELEKGLALGINLEKIISCNCKDFPSSLELARTIEIMPSLKDLKLTREQFTFLLREETFVKSEAFYLSCLSQDSELLELCPEEVKDNKSIVLAAIKNGNTSFRYASENLRNDLEVALAAFNCESSYVIQRHMGENLKSNRQFFLKAVMIDPWIFTAASEELKNDAEIVLSILRKSGIFYLKKLIGEDLKRDREFFLEAVAVNRGVLKYASEDLKGDKDFLLKAIAIHEDALNYAGEELKKDRDLLLAVLSKTKSYHSIGNYIKKYFKEDKDFLLKAMAITPWAFEYAEEGLKNDPEIALVILAQDGTYHLKKMGQELKSNRQFFLKAVAIRASIFEYAAPELKNDPELALAAIAKRGHYSLQYIGDELKDNAEFFIAAQKMTYRAINYASPRVQRDIRVLAVDSSFYSFILKLGNFVSWARQMGQKGWNWFKSLFKS